MKGDISGYNYWCCCYSILVWFLVPVPSFIGMLDRSLGLCSLCVVVLVVVACVVVCLCVACGWLVGFCMGWLLLFIV